MCSKIEQWHRGALHHQVTHLLQIIEVTTGLDVNRRPSLLTSPTGNIGVEDFMGGDLIQRETQFGPYARRRPGMWTLLIRSAL